MFGMRGQLGLYSAFKVALVEWDWLERIRVVGRVHTRKVMVLLGSRAGSWGN